MVTKARPRSADRHGRAATILDVASLAGVSRSTVSRVLNHPSVVPEDTIARVESAIAELKFEPSAHARSLRTGRSNTIALLVGDAAQPFQSELSKAVARSAEAKGISVLLCDLDHSEDRLISFLQQLPRQGVDGIVISTADDLSLPRVRVTLDETRRAGIPVLISGRVGNDDPNGVGLDFEAVAFRATTHLLSTGVRRPVLLLGYASNFIGSRLVSGYRKAVETTGAESVVLENHFSTDAATTLVLEQLLAPEPADGVVASTMVYALSALRAGRVARREVPGDVSIVVCEDARLAELVSPSISTVGASAEDIGHVLVSNMSRLIDGDEPVGATLPIVTTERESTARLMRGIADVPRR